MIDYLFFDCWLLGKFGLDDLVIENKLLEADSLIELDKKIEAEKPILDMTSIYKENGIYSVRIRK